MRRSEMILVISRNIQKHENILNGYAKGSIPLKCCADNLATYILNAIEKQGMLPPEVQQIFWDRSQGGYAMMSEWESEDE